MDTNINDYKLPVCDTDKERRNFTGYMGSKQVYSLADLVAGDTSGTTETDSATASKDGGYTRINSK